jgi:hypothetical protein
MSAQGARRRRVQTVSEAFLRQWTKAETIPATTGKVIAPDPLPGSGSAPRSRVVAREPEALSDAPR